MILKQVNSHNLKSESERSDTKNKYDVEQFETNLDSPKHDGDEKTQPDSAQLDAESYDTRTSDEMDITINDLSDIIPTVDYEGDSLTVRMWVLALILTVLIIIVDCFFALRYPTLNIGTVVAQVLAFPLGRAWDRIVPNITIPLPYGKGIALNPGPFNRKEHACIYMFSNMGISANIVITLIVEQYKYFKQEIGIGRMILFNLGSYFTGLAWAGLTEDLLVTPADSIWPGILSNCALFTAFHRKEESHLNTWKISQFKFFSLVFSVSFVWYWFPDLIAPFLSYIGAWISWCSPTNAVLSQVFGVFSGLGVFPLTLDWAQVSSLSNPLTTPFWSVSIIFASFVFWIWIIMPALYYQDYWQTGHFPIMTSSIFNSNGTSYLASNVVNSDWELDLSKLEEYSPVMLPIAFLMNIAVGLATFSAVSVMFIFEYKESIFKVLKNEKKDVHNLALRKYKRFHWSVYVTLMIIGLVLGIIFSVAWGQSLLTAGGFLVAMIIAGVLYYPVAAVESRSNFFINLTSFYDIVAAFWFDGKPLHLVYFYNTAFGTTQHAMHFSQSAKVGHYMKVPPKHTMIVLFAAGVWASITNTVITSLILTTLDDVCTPDAPNNMTCKKIQTTFNKHLVWGLFGKHIFSVKGRYSWVLWFFLAGAVLALFVVIMRRFRPNAFWKKFSPTLFFAGASSIPSVTGINYSTWFVVAFIFNFFVYRRYKPWWRKYNLVLAIGLDVGVAIAALIIYFCVVFTGGSDKFSWWGTTVASAGCDSIGCPYINTTIEKPSGW